MKKVFDLAVKVGNYKNQNGEIKNRYENVGAIMEGENGQFMFLKRTFNPAGVDVQDGKESIIISMFAPREKTENSAKDDSTEWDDQHPVF